MLITNLSLTFTSIHKSGNGTGKLAFLFSSKEKNERYFMKPFANVGKPFSMKNLYVYNLIIWIVLSERKPGYFNVPNSSTYEETAS